MTNDQIQEILREHKMWLDSDGLEGKRADLHEEDLCRANLRGANLRNAFLIGADLRGADLTFANLQVANLYSANLSGAHLTFANLHGADLVFAKLGGADFHGADLRDVDLHDAMSIPYIPMACPSEGSFIGWKKAHDMIVKLQIPEDAKRSSATGRKCRCNKAVVLAIEHLNGSSCFGKSDILEYACTGVLYDVYGNAIAVRSNYDNCFIYRIGETVSVDNFDTDRFHECAPGIHFFIDRQEAVDY